MTVTLAAVGLDNAADDAEPEAVAVNLLRLCLGAAIERLEDVRQVGRWDAEPAILYDDLHLAAATRARLARAHAHPWRGPAVLDGVPHQVLERRAQRRWFREHRWKVRGDVTFERGPCVGDRRSGDSQRVLDNLHW